MAYPTEKSKQLAELIKQGETSRLMLTEANTRLKHTLDMPSRIKSSIKGTPSKWLGGSLALGLAASLLFRGGKKKTHFQEINEKKQRGLLPGLVSIAFSLSKPAVKIYATKLLKDYLSRRLMGAPEAHKEAMGRFKY